MAPQECYLPGEWQQQSGVLITWPHQYSDWANDLDEIEKLYIDLCRAITQFQKLLIIVYDEKLQKRVESLIVNNNLSLEEIIFFIAKTNDTWTRDYGPISLNCNSKIRLLNFTFNGWGSKYSSQLDNQIVNNLLEHKVLNTNESSSYEFILEGGSIESDGNGSILTTSSCLLSNTRNSSYSQQDIEAFLQNTLGITQVLWLDHGYLAGDDTGSHIDVLARFINPTCIVHVKCEDPNDEHFASSLAMEKQLQTFRNCNNEAYELVPLPFPSAKYDKHGRRLPASYANFLIINGAVLVPTYDDPNDETALNIFRNCFKKREVIGIPFNAAIQQNGSLHCLTMQLPAGVLN